MDYSPWGHKELNMPERLSLTTTYHIMQLLCKCFPLAHGQCNVFLVCSGVQHSAWSIVGLSKFSCITMDVDELFPGKRLGWGSKDQSKGNAHNQRTGGKKRMDGGSISEMKQEPYIHHVQPCTEGEVHRCVKLMIIVLALLCLQVTSSRNIKGRTFLCCFDLQFQNNSCKYCLIFLKIHNLQVSVLKYELCGVGEDS